MVYGVVGGEVIFDDLVNIVIEFDEGDFFDEGLIMGNVFFGNGF